MCSYCIKLLSNQIKISPESQRAITELVVRKIMAVTTVLFLCLCIIVLPLLQAEEDSHDEVKDYAFFITDDKG